MRFAWSASRIQFQFRGTSLVLHLTCLPGMDHDMSREVEDFYALVVDGEMSVLRISDQQRTYPMLEGLTEGVHEVILFKRTEASVAEGVFKGIELSEGGELLTAAPRPRRKIEFIGNSITCGYGNEGPDQHCHFSPETENAWLTYSHLAAQRLGAEYVSICYSGRGVFQNYNKTREGTLPQIWDLYSPQLDVAWDFSWIPNMVVVNLGTNDFAGGVPDAASFNEAYQDLFKDIRQRYPMTKIVCITGSMMQGAPLDRLREYLDQCVRELGEVGIKGIYRLDMSPQGDLGYGCDWHPSVAQHEKNARELAEYLDVIWP